MARIMKEGGARILRGGALARSSLQLQGLGVPGLMLLRDAARAGGLLSVTEVMEAEQIEPCLSTRTSSRSGRGTCRLQPAPASRNVRPILLKPGSPTMEEWLMSASTSRAAGHDVSSAKRDRTFETYTQTPSTSAHR